MMHVTDPKTATNIQSIMFYAKAICDAAAYVMQSPKDTADLDQAKAYYREKSQTLKDILTQVEADLV
jgi:hypothetical protein